MIKLKKLKLADRGYIIFNKRVLIHPVAFVLIVVGAITMAFWQYILLLGCLAGGFTIRYLQSK